MTNFIELLNETYWDSCLIHEHTKIQKFSKAKIEFTKTMLFLDSYNRIYKKNPEIFTFMAGIFIFPTIRNDFKSRFILHKNKLYLTIGLPIIIGRLMQFIVTSIRFIPTLLGHEMIGIGLDKITYTTEITKAGFLFLVTVIGPFQEEIFLALADLKVKFSWANKIYNQLFTHKNSLYIWSWILITNLGLTLLHGPDISNFYAYFIPGLINALLFLRLGFLSAWLAHGVFNLSSMIILSILSFIFLK